jgi:hypothetical protein
MNEKASAAPHAPVAPELPTHGYVVNRSVRDSDIPADYTFVLRRDEIYVPVALRKPGGGACGRMTSRS